MKRNDICLIIGEPGIRDYTLCLILREGRIEDCWLVTLQSHSMGVIYETFVQDNSLIYVGHL